jgi:hypothetical protein
MLYTFRERFLLLLQTEKMKSRTETRLANVLDDIPEVFLENAGNIQLISHRRRACHPRIAITHDRATKLATSDRRRQAVLADRNLLIDDLVRKAVFAPGHGADKDGDRMGLREGRDVVGQLDRFRIGREGYIRIYNNIVISRAEHLELETTTTPETHSI